MGRMRIKITLLKEFKKVFRGICRELWKYQFGSEFSGPNQGATCEQCLFSKAGECFDWIPPEKCIEESAKSILTQHVILDFKQQK